MRSGRIPVFLFEQQGTPSKSHNRASVVGIRCGIVSIAGDGGVRHGTRHRQPVLAPGKHPDRFGLLGFLTTKAMAEDGDFLPGYCPFGIFRICSIHFYGLSITFLLRFISTYL